MFFLTTGFKVVVFNFLNLNAADKVGRFWGQNNATPEKGQQSGEGSGT